MHNKSPVHTWIKDIPSRLFLEIIIPGVAWCSGCPISRFYPHRRSLIRFCSFRPLNITTSHDPNFCEKTQIQHTGRNERSGCETCGRHWRRPVRCHRSRRPGARTSLRSHPRLRTSRRPRWLLVSPPHPHSHSNKTHKPQDRRQWPCTHSHKFGQSRKTHRRPSCQDPIKPPRLNPQTRPTTLHGILHLPLLGNKRQRPLHAILPGTHSLGPLAALNRSLRRSDAVSPLAGYEALHRQSSRAQRVRGPCLVQHDCRAC